MTEHLSTERPAGMPAGHLAVPDGEGPWPGIVVLPEAFGLNEDIRAHADRLATLGYLAFAPDVFTQKSLMRCVMSAFRELNARSGPTFEHIEASRAWLAARADCTGRTGVIGFCLGGSFALLAAVLNDFDVASVNYGPKPPRNAEALTGVCPVVGSYGRRDPSLRGAAAKLERALTGRGVEHDVKEYPDAGHGFLNSSHVPLIARVAAHAGFSEPDSADAWERIEAFFAKHLVGAGSAAG